MARVRSSSLRIGTTDRTYVDVHIDFSLNFNSSEAGFRYKVGVEFHGVDKGPITYIPGPLFTKVFDDEFISTAGNSNHTRKIRFSREALNEDKNGKDEIFCVVNIIPVAPRFSGRTPELQYEFEEGKGRRNK